MNVFEKLSNGWTLSMNSLSVLKENKQLIIFPILSGVSMILIIGSFIVAMFASAGWDIDGIHEQGTVVNYVLAFLFYLINYFVVVFFNTALIECTRDYFNGEVPSVKKGSAVQHEPTGYYFLLVIAGRIRWPGTAYVAGQPGLIGKNHYWADRNRVEYCDILCCSR